MNGATTLPCATTRRPPITTSTATSGIRKIFLRWRASAQILLQGFQHARDLPPPGPGTA